MYAVPSYQVVSFNPIVVVIQAGWRGLGEAVTRDKYKVLVNLGAEDDSQDQTFRSSH